MAVDERRYGNNKRIGEERRKFADPTYCGPERRSGKDRRTARDRRKLS